jgi:dihydropyrimidinase
VYEGWQVTGWPVTTIRRGEVVFRDDAITAAPGSGKVLRQTAAGSL